jgi:hypothetical protein
MFTNAGLSGVQYAIGVLSDNRPQYIAIGSGSGTEAVTNNVLLGEYSRRQVSSTSTSTANEIAYTADWNSIEMSGLSFAEFGMFTQSGAYIGSLWSRNCFDALEFDGTNDLQIQLTYSIS